MADVETAPFKLSLRPIAVRLHDAGIERPTRGQICPCCEIRLPTTALEVWMAKRGMTFDLLAKELARNAAVIRWFVVKRRRPVVNKNVVWRLNHQKPGWKPPRWSPARPIQNALLKLTGLTVEDLQNEKPKSGGYANPAERSIPPETEEVGR